MIKGTTVITLLSEKGGVGKSFLAREVMASMERMGDDAELVNIDPQYAVASSVGGHDIAVLDTPGHLGNRFDLLVAVSDVIIIPTRPTAANVEPLCRVVSLVRAATDVPVLIVVDGWNRHSACEVWMAWLAKWIRDEDIDGHDVFIIPQSEAIARAELSGTSVVEAARHGYARGLSGLVMEVVNAARRAARLDEDVTLDGTHAASDATDVLSSAQAVLTE